MKKLLPVLGSLALPLLLVGCLPPDREAASDTPPAQTAEQPAAPAEQPAGAPASATGAMDHSAHGTDSAGTDSAGAGSADAGSTEAGSTEAGSTEAGTAPGDAGTDTDGAAGADAPADLPLTVTQATVTAVPPSLSDTAAYVSLKNTGTEDIVLTGGSSPAAAHVMLMETVESQQGSSTMSGMVDVSSVTVPAGGELVMDSAGTHVMLMGLTEPLQEGAELPLTLHTSDGASVDVSAVVTKP